MEPDGKAVYSLFKSLGSLQNDLMCKSKGQMKFVSLITKWFILVSPLGTKIGKERMKML